jgi:hypothetical protein
VEGNVLVQERLVVLPNWTKLADPATTIDLKPLETPTNPIKTLSFWKRHPIKTYHVFLSRYQLVLFHLLSVIVLSRVAFNIPTMVHIVFFLTLSSFFILTILSQTTQNKFNFYEIKNTLWPLYMY